VSPTPRPPPPKRILTHLLAVFDQPLHLVGAEVGRDGEPRDGAEVVLAARQLLGQTAADLAVMFRFGGFGGGEARPHEAWVGCLEGLLVSSTKRNAHTPTHP